MNHTLLFNFSINKGNNTIHVTRELDAPVELVWEAFTDASLLDQWWGPNPYKAVTKLMDFRENGTWQYAMSGPGGLAYLTKTRYISIAKGKSFTARDGFCDENGKINQAGPQNFWVTTFSVKGSKTEVDQLFVFDNARDMEQLLAMHFEKGLTDGLNQLDQLLTTLKQA